MSKQWKVWLANICIGAYRLLSIGPKATCPPVHEQRFGRLVVFSTTALGDFMLNTPAIRALRNRYPDASITLVANPRNRDLVSACPYIDDFVFWDHKAKSIVATIWRLRKRKPQLAVILHSKAPYDLIAAVFAGCSYLFKNIYDDELPGQERWLEAATWTCDEGHLIQSKLDLVGHLGCDTSNPEMFAPVRAVTSGSPGSIVIGFQLGASQPVRCWPIEHFIRLAKALLAEAGDIEIALIGSDRERSLENALLSGLTVQERQRVVSYVGRTTLPTLLAVIQRMKVLVTGDTGPLHLAIALKVKTVSLFATASPRKTGPYQDMALHKVLHVAMDRRQLAGAERLHPMAYIQVDEVLHAVMASMRGAETGYPQLVPATARAVQRTAREEVAVLAVS
ncbi:glycosyltransferase family 9 protein [Cupriavidus taiwanensis]|uniref:ADP-heptose--LPS heptosyltransferase glycosyltransferase 9 family n=1 Tax=Cupriavidus taiwanensis TaxID=164546 RepID=A0A7Z7JDM0_9BURK|nr:glycosyltransferase family 9 protein [Cupriavidus taiwanensis]SOZ09002.1 Putative ADP-heptose--LPS heptosyltransferase; glycosyltransferase 9 family [Cupriavidus taiwanensis]SOZ11252.1 Putative ADP-heptose--LPS heptosyltransferase; glycosyltransferase 9 family [Cupriavidus taiwanensis]SOZ42604.1 Putative ADP-heptose--LPS heptosyltransferase; glycosyltransferase 9 family [Cupriavidus taiwanensis]SPC21648.1 Putative ADP-heptose--LPS heptosyltransferase; glycosyltransferase 9 family [Cupriavidu